MKALGTYIFAGGFTLGVKKHFDVEAHFEMKPGLYKKQLKLTSLIYQFMKVKIVLLLEY